jgi:hypothetical protein
VTQKKVKFIYRTAEDVERMSTICTTGVIDTELKNEDQRNGLQADPIIW